MKWKCAVVLSTVLSLAIPAASDQASPEAERVAQALHQLFETISYTRTDFLVDYERANSSRTVLASETDHRTYAQSESYLIMPFLQLLAGLQSLGPESAMRFENGFDEVVGGAAGFNPPKGVGAVDYTACYVGIGKPGGGGPDMAATVSADDRVLPPVGAGKPIPIKAPRKEIMAGTADMIQWSWRMPVGEGHPGRIKQFYAMKVGDDFLLCDDAMQIAELMKLLTGSPFAITHSQSPYVHLKPKADLRGLSTHTYWAYRTLDADSAGVTALVKMPADTTSIVVYADPSDQGADAKITSGDRKVSARALNDFQSLFTAVTALGFGVSM
jgi:hypothetical protein